MQHLCSPPLRQRCAIYTRKSALAPIGQEVTSLESQRAICSAYIASQQHKGWLELSLGRLRAPRFSAAVASMSVRRETPRPSMTSIRGHPTHMNKRPLASIGKSHAIGSSQTRELAERRPNFRLRSPSRRSVYGSFRRKLGESATCPNHSTDHVDAVAFAVRPGWISRIVAGDRKRVIARVEGEAFHHERVFEA